MEMKWLSISAATNSPTHEGSSEYYPISLYRDNIRVLIYEQYGRISPIVQLVTSTARRQGSPPIARRWWRAAGGDGTGGVADGAQPHHLHVGSRGGWFAITERCLCFLGLLGEAAAPAPWRSSSWASWRR